MMVMFTLSSTSAAHSTTKAGVKKKPILEAASQKNDRVKEWATEVENISCELPVLLWCDRHSILIHHQTIPIRRLMNWSIFS